MFKKEKKSLGISNLEKRICDIENPYKYELGNEVSIEYQLRFKYIKGKIVEKKCKYINPQNEWKNDFSCISSYHLDFLTDGYYKRVNSYLVYIDSEKNSVWREESEIFDKNKKDGICE